MKIMNQLPGSAIKEKAKEVDFWGTISLTQGNETFEFSRGWRDLSNGLPNQPDTAFGLASGTKTFTAAGIMVLIDQGKLSLNTTAGELFGREQHFIDPRATIAQLLNHSSGVFDYFDEETITDFDSYKVEIPWCELETPAHYLPLFEKGSMKFKAGKRLSYSNGGFVLLGIIIERTTDMLYRDFMKDYVLKPAGMEHSGFYAFNNLPGNTALGYLEKDGHLVSNIYQLPIRGGGDGGMYSTKADIRRFWEALTRAELFSKESRDYFLSPRGEISSGMAYGCGIYLPRPKRYLMDGCDGGVGYKSLYDSHKEITLTVLSNRTEGENEIYHMIREFILDND